MNISTSPSNTTTPAYNHLLELLSPAHFDIQEIIKLSWATLQGCLDHNAASSHKEEVSAVSTIIHKIMCSFTQMQTTETALCAPFLNLISKEKNIHPWQIAKKIKEDASTTLDAIHPNHETANRVFATSCKKLRYLLSNCTSLNDLNDLTTTLHKLTPNYCQLKSIEINAYHLVLKQNIDDNFPLPPYIKVLGIASATAQTYNRPLAQPALVRGLEGASEHRIRAYELIREDSSTEVTHQSSSKVGLCKRSNVGAPIPRSSHSVVGSAIGLAKAQVQQRSNLKCDAYTNP